jgi:hypothetical protein
MQPRINHQPTDRNKTRWKAIALFALIGFWLLSGIVGREPWKPEPIYIGILQSLLDEIATGGRDWWTPWVAGVAQHNEFILIHWINAPLVLLAKTLLPLHEAARVSTAVWAGFGVIAIALAARRWSGGHISYLAAIIAIGCAGFYELAHKYSPDITVFAALAIALYGCAELPAHPRRATALLVAGVVSAFAARSALGYLMVALPMALLCLAPVFSMYRVVLVRALLLATLLCGIYLVAFALRDSGGFEGWIDADFGFKLEDRDRFGPTFYLGTLLWFAWPAWPIAVWLITLRVRGFAGGWQRGEVVAPAVFFVSGFALIGLLTEPRASHALYLLPPLVVLAAFGVDTLKRTWYALIDWFGILVLGITALLAVLVASAVYYGWPPMFAHWLAVYVPGFTGTLPSLGYGVALLAFVVWIALIQPAHQHARRALINWAGCVTFLWIVAQALLATPHNYTIAYRGVFTELSKAWPSNGCVNSIDLSTSQAAMLFYYVDRQTEPVDAAVEAQCAFVLLQRYRGEPIGLPEPEYKLRFRGNRPGDNAEAFELYEKTASTAANSTVTVPAPVQKEPEIAPKVTAP